MFAKGVYLAGVCGMLVLWPDLDMDKFYGVMMRWPRTGGPIFASHFATWDAAHYLFLSELGYGPGVRSDAFYPLWPLLVRWVSALTGGHDVIVGMILANVLSAAAFVLFYAAAGRRFGESVAKWALVWLAVFPGSLFYQFLYSEPVFFLLVVGLWFGLERRRYGVAWVSASMLPLARAVGVFCVLPIGWHLLMRRPVGPMRGWQWVERERERMDAEGGSSPGLKPGGGMADAGAAHGMPYGLLLAPLLGWGIYLALMWGWTANPFEGIEAQKYWGVHSVCNLWDVPKFVIGWFTPTQWHEFTGSTLDRLMFLVLVYTLPVIWRLGKDLVVWTYVLAILPAMSGTFTSYTRFASEAFPMFLALAVFFERRRMPLLKWGLFATFAILHVVLLWRFVNFRWAG
ncbi:MAG: hypothetical protein KGS61_14900 [Verrucomicrobia bacterium]|nr:hypothetical protein [Verrucomicrobiota bacterium]